MPKSIQIALVSILAVGTQADPNLQSPDLLAKVVTDEMSFVPDPVSLVGAGERTWSCSDDGRDVFPTSGDDANGTYVLGKCTSNCDSSSIWGTDIYTDDSRICTAARHAVNINGGMVKIRWLHGLDGKGDNTYKGSDRNGIDSRDYGSSSSSFCVAAPDGTCGPEIVRPQWGCGKDGNDVFRGNYQAGQTVQAECLKGCNDELDGQRIWGTGIYTDDSSICTAAVHMGVVDAATGGMVKVSWMPGCGKGGDGTSYIDSTAHGVESVSYSSSSTSFCVSKPDEDCTTNTACTWKCSVSAVAVFKTDAADGTEKTQMCAKGCNDADAKSSNVWGSGAYSAASSICKAAVHAGAITAKDGGRVKVHWFEGCEKYYASDDNGVNTKEFEKYTNSFCVSKPDEECNPSCNQGSWLMWLLLILLIILLCACGIAAAFYFKTGKMPGGGGGRSVEMSGGSNP